MGGVGDFGASSRWFLRGPSGMESHVPTVVPPSSMHPLLACLLSLSHPLIFSLVLPGVTSLINHFLSSPLSISALAGTKSRKNLARV